MMVTPASAAEGLSPVAPGDDAVPGAGSLLAPEGVGAVAEFLRRNRWALVDARPEQVRAVPGRSWTARFQVSAVDANDRPRRLAVTAETTRRPRELPAPPGELADRIGLPEPVATIGPYRLWTFPYDPDLPDLPHAMSGPFVRAALARTNLVHGRPVGVAADLVRYRPGRRAVVRYTVLRAGQRPQKLFGKVLRPHRADHLDAALAALGPVSRRHRRSVGLSVPTRLFGASYVAPAIAGVPLRTRLLEGGPLPHPRRVAELPAEFAERRLVAPLPPFDERRHPIRLTDHAARLLAHVAPSTAAAVGTVVETVHAGVATGWAPTRLVHGDLYDDQLFVDDGFSLGLVDYDDLGLGDPAMDAANCCAHLLVLGMLFPDAGRRLIAYRHLVRRGFLDRLGITSGDLAWREALAVLLLATGPFRVLSPTWPSETARLVDLAARLATTPEMAVS